MARVYPQLDTGPLQRALLRCSLVVMGYQTDFVGYLQIEPPLGPREQALVNRISGSPFLYQSTPGLRIADQDD